MTVVASVADVGLKETSLLLLSNKSASLLGIIFSVSTGREMIFPDAVSRSLSDRRNSGLPRKYTICLGTSVGKILCMGKEEDICSPNVTGDAIGISSIITSIATAVNLCLFIDITSTPL
jgi:hypothetical protein